MKNRRVVLLLSMLAMCNSFGMDQPPKELSVIERQSQKIFTAIENYNNDKIESIVEKNPAVINAYHYHKRCGCEVTPLHLAVALDNIMGVELLLKLKADPNIRIKNEADDTPLHRALSIDVVKLLVQHGAVINVRNGHDNMPLFESFSGFKSSRFDIAHYLLKNGADGNAQFKCNSETLLHNVVRCQKKYAIQQLLEHGVNPEQYDKNGKTPFDIALAALETSELSTNVTSKMTSMDYFKHGGVLFYPATLADFQYPYRLLENNAFRFKKLMRSSPQAIEAENVLAELFIALQRGKDNKPWQAIVTDKKGSYFYRASFADLEQWVGKDAVDYVKKHFANVCNNLLIEYPSHNGQVLYYAVNRMAIEQYPCMFAYNVDNLSFDLLSCIIMTGNIADLRWLLSNYTCNLQGVDEDGDTLLHKSMSSDIVPEAVELLIKHGINCAAHNEQGLTAYALAKADGLVLHERAFLKAVFREFRNVSCGKIKKLLDNGLDVNTCDPEIGKSLLLQAAWEGSFEKCSLLLQRGAHVNAEGYIYSEDKKYSPLLWAVTQNKNNLIMLFLKHGALVTQKMLKHVYKDHSIYQYTDFCEAMRGVLQKAYNKQQAYEEQKCCICFEHHEARCKVPCKNLHNAFMCADCQNNRDTCPYCDESFPPLFLL